jgi:hypothetical protein
MVGYNTGYRITEVSTMLPQQTTQAANEASSIDRAHPSGRLMLPSRHARLRARLRAGALERALIAGADPSDSPQLAARAAQLTSPRTRATLAAGLNRLVHASEGPQRRWWAASQREPLVANAGAIDELAELLCADTPLYARGVAIVSRLLSDGSGPLYRGSGARIASEVGHARAAMRS